jgi:hypothetical protein
LIASDISGQGFPVPILDNEGNPVQYIEMLEQTVKVVPKT